MEAQLSNVAVHVHVKVGGRLVSILGIMVCFHLCCSTLAIKMSERPIASFEGSEIFGPHVIQKQWSWEGRGTVRNLVV